MKLCIGVIIYNPDKIVLKRINKYAEISDNIVLFDNSDKNNEVSQVLSSSYENYVSKNDNQGLSEAISYFFNKARDLQSDLLLTMDQDSDFSNDNIIKMMQVIQKENDDNYIVYCPNYRKVYLNSNDDKVIGSPKIGINEYKAVDFSMTSGSFYKIKFLDYFYPIHNLFIGYVDHEICFNVLSNNKKIKMIGDVIFNQEVGDIVRSNIYNRLFHVVRHKDIRYQYMFRNNLFLTNRFKTNAHIKRKLRRERVRLIINILVGEKKKLKKLNRCYKGYRDYKKQKEGKIVLEE